MQRKVFSTFAFYLCFIVTALFSNVASAVDYLLGPDDVVKITIYNQPDLSTEAQITKNGTITFPLLGEVHIGGLEKSAAETLIAEKLLAGNFIKQPQVNLLVTQYRSRRVSVLGHVNKPGVYTIDRVSYVTDLVSQASGVAVDGADIATLIKKSGDGKVQKQNIDLIKLFDAHDNTENYEVSDGDIIYVGRAPIFYIYGEVQKPGGYRLERGMNVMQAISVGGGLTPRGTERGLRVNRLAEDGNLRIFDVDTNTALKENDVIRVKQRLF
ncbi:MAG: polysaccharide export protein EpsE [Pseudomonadota bacterium]